MSWLFDVAVRKKKEARSDWRQGGGCDDTPKMELLVEGSQLDIPNCTIISDLPRSGCKRRQNLTFSHNKLLYVVILVNEKACKVIILPKTCQIVK